MTKKNNYSWNLDNVNFISHYGVLGMKWGVRRYQNYDGSLTTAGRKHVYNRNEADEISRNYRSGSGEVDSSSLDSAARATWDSAKKRNQAGSEACSRVLKDNKKYNQLLNQCKKLKEYGALNKESDARDHIDDLVLNKDSKFKSADKEFRNNWHKQEEELNKITSKIVSDIGDATYKNGFGSTKQSLANKIINESLGQETMFSGMEMMEANLDTNDAYEYLVDKVCTELDLERY